MLSWVVSRETTQESPDGNVTLLGASAFSHSALRSFYLKPKEGLVGVVPDIMVALLLQIPSWRIGCTGAEWDVRNHWETERA